MDYIRHGRIAKNKRELKEINSFLILFFFLFSGKRHFLLRQLAERDDVTRFRCLKISEKIWLIYLFFAYLQRCWGCAFSPLQFWFFPRNEKHTQRRNKIDVCLMIEEKSFKKEMTTVITAAAMCV